MILPDARRRKEERMKSNIKKLTMALVCALVLTVAVPAGIGTQTGLVTTAQAAAKISKTSKTLAVGQTYTLKVTGTTGNVTWSSSNKKIVKVSKTGKIRAIKKGTAVVTAKVNGRTLRCTVNVKKNIINFVGNTPWKTGYYDIGQYGLLSNIEVTPISLSYTSGGVLKFKMKLYNNGNFNWTRISKIVNIYIKTNTGKVLVDMDEFISSNPFALPMYSSVTLTLAFKGRYVKNIVDLTKINGIKYTIDIYKNDAWRN